MRTILHLKITLQNEIQKQYDDYFHLVLIPVHKTTVLFLLKFDFYSLVTMFSFIIKMTKYKMIL